LYYTLSSVYTVYGMYCGHTSIHFSVIFTSIHYSVGDWMENAMCDLQCRF
jgi:hypothetical protein